MAAGKVDQIINTTFSSTKGKKKELTGVTALGDVAIWVDAVVGRDSVGAVVLGASDTVVTLQALERVSTNTDSVTDLACRIEKTPRKERRGREKNLSRRFVRAVSEVSRPPIRTERRNVVLALSRQNSQVVTSGPTAVTKPMISCPVTQKSP